MYQVTAECVYATVSSPYGLTRQLLLKGALIPGDAQELEHLVASGMVAKVGSDDVTGINALGGLGTAETDQGAAGSIVTSSPTMPPAGPTDEEKAEAVRAAARAKLPADGAAPHANSGRDVWVEYAVSKGMDRTEAEQADKPDLVAALKS